VILLLEMIESFLFEVCATHLIFSGETCQLNSIRGR
jgi:hypothetical protein